MRAGGDVRLGNGLADVEPVTLAIGAEADFEDVITRLVELAYTRVDMVGKRGEFAVREAASQTATEPSPDRDRHTRH